MNAQWEKQERCELNKLLKNIIKSSLKSNCNNKQKYVYFFLFFYLVWCYNFRQLGD